MHKVQKEFAIRRQVTFFWANETFNPNLSEKGIVLGIPADDVIPFAGPRLKITAFFAVSANMMNSLGGTIIEDILNYRLRLVGQGAAHEAITNFNGDSC